MTRRYDIAVLGSGFSGSLIGMIARRLGRSVVMLEKGTHPRVVIGESSTPLSNLLLETLATRYDLPQLKPLTKWGTWQSAYPEIACGLKRGFTFFHHDLAGPATREQHPHLLVAASPHNAIADTHWFRADTDQFFMQEACRLGVDHLDGCNILHMAPEGDSWALSGTRQGSTVAVRATFLIDATGPRGLLHRSLGLAEAALPHFPQTSALFSHFSGVDEFRPLASPAAADPPYPPDAAALHHVFPGGWMWVLRFNNGWTSAGFAVADAIAEKYSLRDGEPAWQRLLHALPDVAHQFRNARAERPFTHTPRLSFRSASIAGAGWALLPSAAGFVDPLLSTGFSLTLLGIARLAEILEHSWDQPSLAPSLQQYAAKTDGELLATARLIAALYANMGDFSLFRDLSLLYFAAASYAETVRRLGKPELAASFLLHGQETFGPASRRILERAQHPLTPSEKLRMRDQIYRLIEPFDVAGLCRRPPDHLYPVRAEDLLTNAAKVGATRPEIDALLRRAGFYRAGEADAPLPAPGEAEWNTIR